MTPLQGTPYIDRDTSDTSTGSEDDSLVEHRLDVGINLDTLQVGQSTHSIYSYLDSIIPPCIFVSRLITRLVTPSL